MGGGISISSTVNIDFSNFEIVGNIASYGAGIYILVNSISGFVTNLRVTNNQASLQSAGLGIESSDNMHISNIIFS